MQRRGSLRDTDDGLTPPFEHDLETLRQLGHATVDLMLEIIATEREDPVAPRISGEESRAMIDEPVPTDPTPPVELIGQIRQNLIPGHRRNGHPRFLGYVCSSADPVGAFADAIASACNQNVTSWRSAPGATEMERLVVRWLSEWIGFGGDGHGQLVAGGSSANLVAVACALSTAVEPTSEASSGRRTADGEPPESRRARSLTPRDRLTTYVSDQAHLSMAKAFHICGVPEANQRLVPTDHERRMLPDALDEMISKDLDRGLVPAVVCASAGTANTGAVDPLEEIAEVCNRRSVWLHVDGAYGAPAATTPEHSWMRRGLAAADSMSIDPHKWLFVPLDAGCVLLRDERCSRAAFAFDSEYARVMQSEPIERFAFFDHGIDLSRRARALKVWMILKAHGTREISRVIASNIALRAYLDRRISAEPELELLGSGLSISCFRVVPVVRGAETDPGVLDELNRSLLDQLLAEGRSYMSPTTLEGRFSLRVCIVSFRTRQSDMDLLLDDVLRIGRELGS